MSKLFEPCHAPFDDPCLALVGWPTIPVSSHSITSVAVDYTLGVLVTGTSAGWLYLWRLFPSECRGQVAPRVACVGEWSGSSAVLQCHFCKWPNPGLFGLNFDKVVASLHEDGMLRLWTVDDGRCLFALPTVSFLGINAFTCVPLSDSRYLLLGARYAIAVFDVWARCVGVVLSFSPGAADVTTQSLSTKTASLTSVISAIARSVCCYNSQNAEFEVDGTLQVVPDFNTTVISVSANSSCSSCCWIPAGTQRTIVSALLSNGTLLTWDITIQLSRWERRAKYVAFVPPKGCYRHQDCKKEKSANSLHFRQASTPPNISISETTAGRRGVVLPEDVIPEHNVLIVPPISITILDSNEWSIQDDAVLPPSAPFILNSLLADDDYLVHVESSYIAIRYGQRQKALHLGGNAPFTQITSTIPHSISSGNISGIVDERIRDFQSRAFGADSSGWNRFEVVKRYPVFSSIDGFQPKLRAAAFPEELPVNTHHDTPLVGLHAASRHRYLQRARQQEEASAPSQPIVRLPNVTSVTTTEIGKSISRQYDIQPQPLHHDKYRYYNPPQWVGVRLVRHVDFQLWSSFVAMAKIRRRSLLLEPQHADFNLKPSFRNSLVSLIFAFTSEGCVYVIKPESPDTEDASVNIEVKDIAQTHQQNVIFFTKLPQSWIPSANDAAPLPFVFISNEPPHPISSKAESYHLALTITFVGISNEASDQLQWARFQLLTPKGTLVPRWHAICLTSSLRLRQIWGNKQHLSLFADSSCTAPEPPHILTEDKYITWTLAEMNGRFFLVSSRLDGRLISFCLNPSRPHSEIYHSPPLSVPVVPSVAVKEPRPLVIDGGQPCTLRMASCSSTEITSSDCSPAPPTSRIPSELSHEPLSCPNRSDSSCSLSVHQRIRFRHSLRTSAKTAWHLTEKAAYPADVFAEEERHILPNTRIATEDTVYHPISSPFKGIEECSQFIYSHKSSEVTSRRQLLPEPKPSAESRRLITSLLSIGRDIIVGGSSSGDLFWWALPKLTLRGSIPGLHSAAIVCLHRLVNVCYGSYALDIARVLSIDSSGGISIVDTSLATVESSTRYGKLQSVEKINSSSTTLVFSSEASAPPAPSGSLPMHLSTKTIPQERIPGSKAEQLKKRHGFMDKSPPSANRENNLQHEKSKSRKNSLLEIPRFASFQHCSNLSGSNFEDHNLHQQGSVVDSGGWSTSWSPELANRRQRGTISSAVYSDSLDLLASGQPRVVRLSRHPDLNSLNIQKVFLDVPTNILILVTSTKLFMFSLTTYSFHSSFSLDGLSMQTIGHRSPATKSEPVELFCSLFQNSILFTLGYHQVVESSTSSVVPTQATLRSSINRLSNLGLSFPVTAGLWSAAPMLRRTSMGIILGHLTLGQTDVISFKPPITSSLRVHQHGATSPHHQSSLEKQPNSQMSTTYPVPAPWKLHSSLSLSDLPQSLFQIAQSVSNVPVILLPLIVLPNLLSNPHFRHSRHSDHHRHQPQRTVLSASNDAISSVAASQEHSSYSRVSTQARHHTSNRGASEYGPALLGYSQLDLLGMFLPHLLLKPVMASLPSGATAPLLKVLFDAYSCRLPMIMGIVGASMSISIPLPSSLLELVPDTQPAPQLPSFESLQIIPSLSQLSTTAATVNLNGADIERHDVSEILDESSFSAALSQPTLSLRSSLCHLNRPVVDISLACRMRFTDASTVQHGRYSTYLQLYDPLPLISKMKPYDSVNISRRFLSAGSGRDPYTAALGLQLPRRRRCRWNPNRVTIALSPQRKSRNNVFAVDISKEESSTRHSCTTAVELEPARKKTLSLRLWLHMRKDQDSNTSSQSNDSQSETSPSMTRTSNVRRSQTIFQRRLSTKAAEKPSDFLIRRHERSRSEVLRFVDEQRRLISSHNAENDCSSDSASYTDWDIPPSTPCIKKGRELQIETSGLVHYYHQRFLATRSEAPLPPESKYSLATASAVHHAVSAESVSTMSSLVRLQQESASCLIPSRLFLPLSEVSFPGAELHTVSSYILVITVVAIDLLLSQMAKILYGYRSQQQFEKFLTGPHLFPSDHLPDIDLYKSECNYNQLLWPKGLNVADFHADLRAALVLTLKSHYKPLLASGLPLLGALALHPTSSQLRLIASFWLSLFASTSSLSGGQRLAGELGFVLMAAEKSSVQDEILNPRKIAQREAAASILGSLYSSKSHLLPAPELLFVSNETISLITLADLIIQRPLSLRGHVSLRKPEPLTLLVARYLVARSTAGTIQSSSGRQQTPPVFLVCHLLDALARGYSLYWRSALFDFSSSLTMFEWKLWRTEAAAISAALDIAIDQAKQKVALPTTGALMSGLAKSPKLPPSASSQISTAASAGVSSSGTNNLNIELTHQLIFRMLSILQVAPYSKLAANVLLEIGRTEPVRLVRALGYAAKRIESGTGFCSNALMILVRVVVRYPLICVKYLSQIVDAVVKCLDPSNPSLRRSTLSAATAALFQLVRVFPMTTFHQATQRFAVGNTDGFVIIFDLRTATKWRVLEGHTAAVSVVGFTEDGAQVASYSAQDQTFCLWQCASSGFLGGILGMSGKCQKLLRLPRTAKGAVLPPVEQLGVMRLFSKSSGDWILKREDGRGYAIRV